MMKLAVIVTAAGASTRYQAAGGVRSKLDEDLGGKPVLQRVVETFTKFDDDEVLVGPIIVAGPHEKAEFDEFAERHADRLALLGAKLVQGGKTHRWESVVAALAAVPSQCTHVAVHDGARPCVSYALLGRVCRAGRQFGAVIPGLTCADTIKRTKETSHKFSGGSDAAAAILGEAPISKQAVRAVGETISRDGVVLVQTPQVFEVAVLRGAYEKYVGTPEAKRAKVTDDASVVELAGGEVIVVEGEARNIKITTPEDVAVARAIMGFKEPEGRAVHKRF